MTCFSPSRDPGDAECTLATLVRPRLDPFLFTCRNQSLQDLFSAYKAYCPPPWASRNLHITPEINYQSELWLPLDLLRPHFYTLYRQALIYPPIFSSTPFAQGASWAAIVARFPDFLKHCSDPAGLLEQLVGDDDLRLKFLFWSFMPSRFYGGGSNRYPGQSAVIEEWVLKRQRREKHLRCLDAASGDGANTYETWRLLMDLGWGAERFEVEGWTLEPLEVWAAAHGHFPHDPAREKVFREETQDCIEQGYGATIRFCCRSVLDAPRGNRFDLILCNGLLGGPIIHDHEDMDIAVRNLTNLLAPGGMLLVEDHFHGGWKQRCPQQKLRALCERYGMLIVKSAEGIYALKPD